MTDNVMEYNQIPGKIKFLIWIMSLIKYKHAKFSEKNSNLINLNSYSSNFFIIGRDKDKQKFIGIQHKMIPWFLEVSWERVSIDYDKGYIYLISTTEYDDALVLGIKCRKKRLEMLRPDKSSEEVVFKIYKQDKGGDVEISKRFFFPMIIEETKDIYEIIKLQDEDSKIESSGDFDDLDYDHAEF